MIRPIAAKLQRSNTDCYEAYEMIGSTIERINGCRKDVDKEFRLWFLTASKLVVDVGGIVSQPRVARGQNH